MRAFADDPLRQQGWSVIFSIHNQLGEHLEASEAAWIGLSEAAEPQYIATRCADVIAAFSHLTASDDPEIMRLADERRQNAYTRLWGLIADQGNDQNPTPAGWMNPTTRSCFANQFAVLRDRGALREASELEMALALALSLPDYRDHEGLHAGDHALNAALRAPTDLQDELFVSFIEVLETTNPLREEPAFFIGALFASVSVDPIPSADRLLPFMAPAQTANQVFAAAQLSHRLAGHPHADEFLPEHGRWRQVAGELLAISQQTVLLPAERALSALSASSPSHPDVSGVFSDARNSALLLAVKLEDSVKRDIAALIMKDGHGLESLAENILR
jgi:hypothetical protein